MLKEEFKELSGLDLTDREFDMVNAIYMLSENQSKHEFAQEFLRYNKDILLSACAQVLDEYRKKNEQQFKEINVLKDTLMKIAVYLRQGEVGAIYSLIKNFLGRKKYLVELWRNHIGLSSDDIDELIDIVQKSNFD